MCQLVRSHVVVPHPQIERLNQYHFLSAKPVIYLVNMKKKSYLKKGGKTYAMAPTPRVSADESLTVCRHCAHQARTSR